MTISSVNNDALFIFFGGMTGQFISHSSRRDPSTWLWHVNCVERSQAKRFGAFVGEQALEIELDPL